MESDQPVAPASRLPDGLEPYSRTASFTEETLPAGLRKDHTTKAGSWGLIRVEQGVLRYRVTDQRRLPAERDLTPETGPAVVEPTILHHVEPIGPVRFHVEFLREPAAPVPLRQQEKLPKQENGERPRH
ncbi:MAG: DUF1971 domain-containing protein [Erythrobacter sp.]|nr:DUF1971 domain-containing protein [Erythrobacter sp.]